MNIHRYLHFYSLTLTLFVFSQSILLAQQENSISSAYADLFEVEGMMSDSVTFPKKIKSVLIVDTAWHILSRKALRKALKAHYLVRFYADSNRMVRVQMIYPPSRKMLEFMKSSRQRRKENVKRLDNQIGELAPHFIAVGLDGSTYSINALRGKVIVLNFWFVNCSPCRKEIPDLNELVKKYNSKDIVFIAIALDGLDHLDEFLASTTVLYNVVPNGREFSNLYNIRGYPTNIVIDTEGNLAFQSTGLGLRSIAKLEKYIRKSLKKFS